MTTETVETIAEVVQTCVDGLIECLAVAALMQNEWAENRLADLNLWISGTGALARGRASLDHRLAARPEVREVVLNSLRLLSTMIDECKEASSPDQGWQSSSEENHDESVEEPPVRSFSPWSDDSSSSSGSESADIRGEKSLPYTSPVEEAMYNVESIIDQLARLAVAIRRSGRRSRLQKADQLFKQEDHKELRDHLVAMFLHKLGLLKGSHDVTDSSKLSDVQMRLIDCNLRRRNRFLYAQKHSRGLVPVKMDSQVQIQMMQSTEISVKREAKTTHGSISSQKEVDVRTVTTLRTGTSASAMSASFLFPTADQMMPSASSSIMSSTIIDLDYPRPPKIMNASHIFRCPCCCESLPIAIANRNKWRKHVSDDLSPYSCVIPECEKPCVLFGSKDTWRDHILRDHSSLTYWVCFACNDGRRFNSEPDFVEHTKLAHVTSIPSDQIPILMDLCKVTAPVEIHRCPLCNWPSEEEGEVEKGVLLNHIAKELHAFSLRSLPWADNNGQEMDQRIAWSSGKVYDWMVQNNIQSNPTQDPPRRDQRLYVSKYFEENDYFADSSGESGTGQAESEFSRAHELDRLKQVEGSFLGLSEYDGSNRGSYEGLSPGTTELQGPGGSDRGPAESTRGALDDDTVSTRNLAADERDLEKEEGLGSIYAGHFSNPVPDYLYASWADNYYPDEIHPEWRSQSLWGIGNHDYEIQPEDGNSSGVKAVSSDDSMEVQHHQNSQRSSHVATTSTEKAHKHEQKQTSGHISQSSEKEACLENEEEEHRQYRETQKAILAKALEKANSALLLDNAANFEGAMQAYTDACQLLQLVIIRSRGGEEEKAKLQEIHDTCMARITELQRMDYTLPDLDGQGLPGSADDGSRVDSQPGSPASTSEPNMNLDSLDLAQAIEKLDERGHEEKGRAGEEQKSEMKRTAEPVLVRNYSMEDARHQDILRQHDEQEYRTRRGSSQDLVNQSNPEVGTEYHLEENRAEPEPSHHINVNYDQDEKERVLRAVESLIESRTAQEKALQRYLEKEQHWNVFNASDENFFAATESDPTELEESSSDDDFHQKLTERPARKKARGSPGDLDSLYDNKRKLTYQHDDTKPNPFHRQDFVPSEPLNQIPEDSGPSSLPKPSKKPSRKENEKGKIPLEKTPSLLNHPVRHWKTDPVLQPNLHYRRLAARYGTPEA